MDDPKLTCVGVYRRRVEGSLERVWENVHDWEHLPHLHRSAFLDIECLESGRWGWRARVGLPPATARREVELELRRSGDDGYVVRTLAGRGRGSEIRTRLEPVAASSTLVEVSFHLPLDDPAQADALGVAYTRLYTGLWDEDEAMIRQRSLQLARRAEPHRSPPPHPLGNEDDLRRRLPLALELDGVPVRLVEVDGDLVAYSPVCPHRLGPLDDGPDERGHVRCPWHGYTFDLRSGRSCDGRNLRLARAPRLARDEATGVISLEWRGSDGRSPDRRPARR
jgi:nitrite reductase (NADH) small subunit/3-phenylpropionate/trans-cinnamate dioxygenase ferredoxin subunit